MCVAIPLEVLSVEGRTVVLKTESGTVTARADLVEVRPGDFVLVHAGFIIEKLSPAEAGETLRLFEEMRKHVGLDS